MRLGEHKARLLRFHAGLTHLRDPAVEELTDEFPADAAVGAGHKRGVLCELSHVNSPGVKTPMGAMASNGAY